MSLEWFAFPPVNKLRKERDWNKGQMILILCKWNIIEKRINTYIKKQTLERSFVWTVDGVIGVLFSLVFNSIIIWILIEPSGWGVNL